MRILNRQFLFGILLIGLSLFLYVIHYLIFKDIHHIVIYLIGDIAFLPLEVFIVTLIIHQILNRYEKQALLKKINMVIGSFFSEVGNDLLSYFLKLDTSVCELKKLMNINDTWTAGQFKNISKNVKQYQPSIEIIPEIFHELKFFLNLKRDFLLKLLENPNLLEHDRFTDLLWAVFHLTDEFVNRKDIFRLPERDYQHLANDIMRAYELIIQEWLIYMKHLKEDYPYLFSFAIRRSPFNPNAHIEFV